MMKTLAFLFSTLATVGAVCPNSCSGHGTCNAFDVCTCYDEGKTLYFGKEHDPISGAAYNYHTGDTFNSVDTIQKQYTGADCSEFTCPRGMSWKQLASATEEHEHKDNVECSDGGICDRSSGQCACFPGYTGAACQRTVCENDCSGHGICQSNVDFSIDASLSAGTPDTAFGRDKRYLNAWDSGLHYGCKCDLGFRGPDCSLQECPSTEDPLGWYGNSDGEDCSGRGLCDYSSGQCMCFPGYTGMDCGTVEALA